MKTNTVIFVVIFLVIIIGGCGKSITNKEDFQKYILGTWSTLQIYDWDTTKIEYEFREYGIGIRSETFDTGMSYGKLRSERTMNYKIGSGIWNDSNEPRYFIIIDGGMNIIL